MATTSINLDNLDGTNGFKWAGSPGSVVSIIGDVNGDGLDDIAIADFDRANGGTTYIIYGSMDPFDATTTPSDVDATLFGGLAGEQAGFSISRIGRFNSDFNGDGIDDFLIGAPSANGIFGKLISPGQTYVVFGTEAGLPTELNLSAIEEGGFTLLGVTGRSGTFGTPDYRPPDLSGYSVSTADFNGDGLADLLVGAPQLSDTAGTVGPDPSASGLAYVVYGTKDPQVALVSLDDMNGVNIVGQVPNGAVGYSISGAGDLNGDGFEEIIVGAPQNASGFDIDIPNTTYSYIIYGSATPPASINLTTPGDQTGDVVVLTGENMSQRGIAVSAAGDINGDGYDDVIAGNWPGIVGASVVFGGPDILPSEINLNTLDGTNGFTIPTDNIRFETAWLSAAGDVNGDGFDDILVGQPGVNPIPQTDASEGVAYLIFGTDQGFPAAIDLDNLDGTTGLVLKAGTNSSKEFGISVSGAGDINGDGFADLAIATQGDGQTEPSSYILFGAADLAEEVGFIFEGGEADDVFVGKGGSDRAFGGPGEDLLIGGDDDDFLFGGADDDILKGGRDDDTLRGGLGRDVQKGGTGDDTFIGTVEEMDGDRILGFGRGDEIMIEGYDGPVEIRETWFGGNTILFDTDGNGSLDGSMRVNGVFGGRSFDVDQVGNDTVITLEDQGVIGCFVSGLVERLTDGWDFF